MTGLDAARPLVRLTAAVDRGRPLVVVLHPGYLTLRRRGSRDAVAVDYGAVYFLGMKKRAEEARAARKGGRR